MNDLFFWYVFIGVFLLMKYYNQNIYSTTIYLLEWTNSQRLIKLT